MNKTIALSQVVRDRLLNTIIDETVECFPTGADAAVDTTTSVLAAHCLTCVLGCKFWVISRPALILHSLELEFALVAFHDVAAHLPPCMQTLMLTGNGPWPVGVLSPVHNKRIQHWR